MTINQAVQRFRWRLTNGWKPNETDLEAFNTIVEFVNNQHKNQLPKNELFAKLYIHLYGKLLNHYNATVFDPEPQKELNRILDRPIENIIEDFRQSLNLSELYQVFQEKGIEVKHPILKTDEQKKREAQSITIQELPEWTYEDVKNQLETQINLALNQYA